MKTAICYDRVNKWGGAERVLLALHEIFPDAPLFTAVYNPNEAKWAKIFPNVIPSYLQKLPYLRDRHELLGTFAPMAFELFDFNDYDLVISVTSEAAKGIITTPPTRHICYCLTPTRYLYSGRKLYKNYPPKYLNFPLYEHISKPFLYYVGKWDEVAAQRPDEYIAISKEVQSRIKKYYKRESSVIHPPVDINKFKYVSNVKKKDYYLLVSRLVPYKKVDMAIEVFNELGKELVIVGKGSEEGKLQAIAGDNISFVGEVTDKKLARHYLETKGLIFPQEEDFGIVAVEAISSGTPVIAYKKGGITDIVEDGVNGVLFDKQTKTGLVHAVKIFDTIDFNPLGVSGTVREFSKDRFVNEFKKYITANVEAKH